MSKRLTTLEPKILAKQLEYLVNLRFGLNKDFSVFLVHLDHQIDKVLNQLYESLGI